MELLKVKTARFREVVKECGAPQVVTLWADPKSDKGFQRALREQRVMSVHQPVVGSKRDFGEVGFVRGTNITYLLFPKSLERFDGRRIIGVDYEHLAEAAPVGAPVALARKSAAHRAKAREPRRTPERDTAALLRELQRAAKASEGGKRRVSQSEQRLPAKTAAAAPKTRPDRFMIAAIEAARKSLKEGGIPIGAALVRKNRIVAVGHNRRVQDDDPVAHAETDCLRRAGRLGSFRNCTLYSTLMPCFFCAGAAVQFGIKRVLVAESRNFAGASDFMREHGIEVVDLDLEEVREMMAAFIREHPKLWNEDIGR